MKKSSLILTSLIALFSSLVLISYHGLAQRLPSTTFLTTDPQGNVYRGEAAQRRLFSQLAEDGNLRVIIEVDTEFIPEGKLSSGNAVTEQRVQIQDVQNSVLEGLDDLDYQNATQFQTIPFIALEVTQAGLEALEQNSLVLSITEDVPVPPTLSESGPIIGADDAWAAGYTGSGQAIAILDTGVDKTHGFLTSKVISEACYSGYWDILESVCPGGSQQSTATGSGVNCSLTIDGCDHGTHVAGIAAGNGASFSGVAKDADLIAIQIFSRFEDPTCSSYGLSSPCALTYTSDQILGLERVYALRSSYDIASVNMSLGGGSYASPCSGDSRESIIANLRSVGIATVIASGNSGYRTAIGAPACVPGAISVGSTNDYNPIDTVSSFSNVAYFMSLFAPGHSIYSSVPGGGYSNFSGTSMAAPQVAGAWAVLKQKEPAATVDEILDALTTTGVLIDDNRSGGSVNDIPRIQVDLALTGLDPTPTPTPTPDPTSLRFAVIGDYGLAGQPEADVAALVISWNPDLVITTGDNNYTEGAASTIDENIGQYYQSFIYPYTGSYGPGATVNRFWPSLGNHDWRTADAQPYLDYFTLPGNERYYDFTDGPVHFFVIDSDPNEPDGTSSSSTQGQWLQTQLGNSTSTWNVVYFHHAPYSSGEQHGSTTYMQWPFESWGADVVLAGHEHVYERLTVGGIPFFVNGLGGGPIYTFGTPISGSQVRYNDDYGAMLVDASETELTYQFINRSGQQIDSFVQTQTEPTPTPTPPPALDTIGTHRNDVFYLRNSNSTGYADLQITYGLSGDIPILGDWDGDGVDTIGIFRDGVFDLRNSNDAGYADLSFSFGLPGDIPLAGDWDGDGIDTIGVFRDGTLYLRNSNSTGPEDIVFGYGLSGDHPIAGDWDGDLDDEVGVYRNGVVFLKAELSTGYADWQYGFGIPGDLPIAGDWDGDGVDSIGVFRAGVFYLRNAHLTGYADFTFGYGLPGDTPLAGDWDG